jgi:CcmD family protein
VNAKHRLAALAVLLVEPLAAAEPATPTGMAAAKAGESAAGGPLWVVAVNLVIWSGLLLYLVRLERRLRRTDAADGRERAR